MVVVKWILTGLMPNSYENAVGMRGISDTFDAQAAKDGHTVYTFRHDWAESPPDTICRTMLAEAEQAKPDYVIVECHSFGAALFLFFAQWMVRWYPGRLVVDRALVFDLAVNGFQFGSGEWIDVLAAQTDNSKRPMLPETSVKLVLEFFQHAGRPWGVCGCPVYVRDGVVLYDVTDRRHVQVLRPDYIGFEDWGDGEPLDHNSLIAASRTQEVSLQFLLQGLLQKTAAAASPASAVGSARTTPGGGNLDVNGPQ